MAVDPDQLRRGLEFLARNKAGRMSAGEILRLAAAHPEDSATPLPVTGIQADGWVGELLGGSVSDNMRFIAVPENFHAKLRPYQERGLSWLAFLSSLGLGACLADDMGLGKTVQLLALEAVHRAERPDDPPTLLLCPMSLVGNWQREAARFAPALRVYAHHGRERLREGELADRLAQADLMVTTYATATRDIEELAGDEWRRVVLDEAQAVKNSLSQAARAVRRLRAGQRVALTGTPVENRLAELWSLMDFLNPGLLGPADKFRTRYAIPVERHGQTEPAERLRAITRPYVLRRLKTDPAVISDLPEKIEIKQYCRLTTEQASLYQSVVDDMMEKIENSRGDRAPGQRAGGDGQAQAGVQPPGAAAARPVRRGCPVRQGDPAGGDLRGDPRRGRQGPAVHPVHRVRRDAAAAPGRAFRHRHRLPARRNLEEAQGRAGDQVPAPTTARRCSCCRCAPGAPG